MLRDDGVRSVIKTDSMPAGRLKKSARLLVGASTYTAVAKCYRIVRRHIKPRYQRIATWKLARTEFSGEFDVVLYCEQPAHWQSIELIATLLSARPNIRVLLIASYVKDDYPDADYPRRLRIAFGIPKAILGHLRTRILYTAYTGLESALRPKEAIIVHSLVSLTGLDGMYSSSSFDHYDYILCAGPHHIRDFKRWVHGNIRLRNKVLVPAGYPKLDLLLEQKKRIETLPPRGFTVVYAPTHVYPVNAKMASLREYGEAIVESLLRAGFRVIFRPHPLSFSEDSEIIERIVKKHSMHENFSLDRSKNYLETYGRANLMVTDLSGTGFTFSLTFLRPTVFFAASGDAEIGLRGIQFEDRDKIGGLARSVPELLSKIARARSECWSSKIQSYRDDTVFNVGSSAECILATLTCILDGRRDDDWIQL